MNEERLAQLKFRWCAGMLTDVGRLIQVSLHTGAWQTDRGQYMYPRVPHLNDELTVLALVLIAGELWGQPDVRSSNMDGYDGYKWILPIVTEGFCAEKLEHTRHGVTWFAGETEAEAAITAIEVANRFRGFR